ncbi:autophagy protein 5, partial [Ascosphaera atra]
MKVLHLPKACPTDIGLLYDFYSAAQAASASRESQHVERGRFDEVTARSNQLPWKLTVHFNDFPEKELVKLDNAGKVLVDSFMNSVKEADFLRNGTAKKIMTLSKEDSSDLWQAVAK